MGIFFWLWNEKSPDTKWYLPPQAPANTSFCTRIFNPKAEHPLCPATRNCQVVVNHVVELTEEEKEQARQDAIDKLRDEEMAKMRRPKTTEKKATENNPQVAQPSLFDL